jgi:hypothetical protein
MFKQLSADKWLGLLACGVALLLIFVWVPLDVDTGITEKVRRQITIGDSLAPVVAGCVILLGGILTFLTPDRDAPHLTRDNIIWLATLLAVITASMLMMRYLGPAIVDLIQTKPYRVLRATPPYNYVGYLLGGTALIAGLNAAVRGRVSFAALLMGLAASLAIALAYDLPFDDLQLPPNGDV